MPSDFSLTPPTIDKGTFAFARIQGEICLVQGEPYACCALNENSNNPCSVVFNTCSVGIGNSWRENFPSRIHHNISSFNNDDITSIRYPDYGTHWWEACVSRGGKRDGVSCEGRYGTVKEAHVAGFSYLPSSCSTAIKLETVYRKIVICSSWRRRGSHHICIFIIVTQFLLYFHNLFPHPLLARSPCVIFLNAVQDAKCFMLVDNFNRSQDLRAC